MNILKYFTAFIILIMCCTLSNQASFDEDLTLTHRQKQALDEFKELVSIRLPHEYMKEDIYLVRWLRARRFDVAAAKIMLMENLKWRKENNIDNILQEDWTDFERDFRFDIQGCDKEGRPVVSVPVGDWDIRRAVVSGKGERAIRYFDKLFEEIAIFIRRSQEKGQNITQYNLIFEMSHYNLVIQGCPMCLPVYIHFFQSYENNYPGSAHSTTLVNVPQIFLTLWQIIRPYLSQETRDTIMLYGKHKTEWQPFLFTFIADTQLTKEFGGQKNEAYTLEQLRDDGGYFQCSKY